jgi:hypothetical protein
VITEKGIALSAIAILMKIRILVFLITSSGCGDLYLCGHSVKTHEEKNMKMNGSIDLQRNTVFNVLIVGILMWKIYQPAKKKTTGNVSLAVKYSGTNCIKGE